MKERTKDEWERIERARQTLLLAIAFVLIVCGIVGVASLVLVLVHFIVKFW